MSTLDYNLIRRVMKVDRQRSPRDERITIICFAMGVIMIAAVLACLPHAILVMLGAWAVKQLLPVVMWGLVIRLVVRFVASIPHWVAKYRNTQYYRVDACEIEALCRIFLLQDQQVIQATIANIVNLYQRISWAYHWPRLNQYLRGFNALTLGIFRVAPRSHYSHKVYKILKGDTSHTEKFDILLKYIRCEATWGRDLHTAIHVEVLHAWYKHDRSTWYRIMNRSSKTRKELIFEIRERVKLDNQKINGQLSKILTAFPAFLQLQFDRLLTLKEQREVVASWRDELKSELNELGHVVVDPNNLASRFRNSKISSFLVLLERFIIRYQVDRSCLYHACKTST